MLDGQMLDPPTGVARDAAGAKGQTLVQEPSPAQRTIARRTAEARATIPDFECSVEVEMTAALAQCQRANCSLDGALMAACAAALRAVPRVNAAYRDGRYELYSRVNVGWVVARGEAYVIPTVFDADEKTPAQLTAEIERLTGAALARDLAPPAFSGATFTLWNAGEAGLGRATAIINPPQAGALAAGAVRPGPVIEGGEVRAGQLMELTLACDHRIVYGALAGQFLAAVRAALASEAPEPGP
jgi:pyruvate dehydrogenase E2 component (dihydrolipoamide acetyltransferase)